MNIRCYAAAIALSVPTIAWAQVKVTNVVKSGDSSIFTQSETFQRYITRGSFCSLILDNLVFVESIPGKFMLDLSMDFKSLDDKQENNLRVLFDDLILIPEPGKPTSLTKSGTWLATKIPLARVATIQVNIRLIPIVDTKYDQAYALLKPLLSQPIIGLPSNIDLAGVFNSFSAIASTDDARKPLLFSATLPVPQNIVEAQVIEKQPGRPPLRNNEVIAISMVGAKPVSDANVIAKAKDFLNGISSFVTGKDLVSRPVSSITGMVALRFTKDFTQPLPESLIDELKDLSDTADQAYTSDVITQVNTKAADAIKSVDAISKSKDIDSRADFHLRGYVEMARVWSVYKKAVSDGGEALKTSQWRNLYKNWYQKQNILGLNNYTQAYGISEIYGASRIAKIFVPYALSDDMTLEMLQRQTSIHQAFADLSDSSVSEKP